MAKKQDEKLNLSHLTPEEIAKRMLETPPPPERQEAKERRKRKRQAQAEEKTGTGTN